MNDRIALVCGSWPPIKCGVGDFSHRLALELARQGHSVVAITDAAAHKDNTPGVEVQPIISHWRPTALPSILVAVRQSGTAVVNLQYPTQQYGRFSAVDLLPLAVRGVLRLPVVTTVHEFSTYRRLGRWRVKTMVRTSDAAIVPDMDNLEALTAAAPVLASRLHHVPLGPTIESHLPADFDRRTWREAHGTAPGALVLAYFGFISPSKGLDLLIDALDRLPSQLEVHLWLLADREPSNPRYAEYHAAIGWRLKRSPLAQRVMWTGYLSAGQLSPYLAAADLAVLPFADGASLRRTTMLAALAHGLPVLSTGARAPCPGVQVTPIGDAEALADAITHLSRDRRALAALAAQAQETARGFSWSVIASRTATVLGEVATRVH